MKLTKLISVIMVYLVVTISFSLYAPKEVSAAQQACCQLTKSGNYCRYTDVADCNTNYLTASNIYCENVDFCKTGCCYDTAEGSCYTGVAKSRCEASKDSVWNPNPSCMIDQCNPGCCQISDQCSLSTQTKCRSIASKYPGAEMIFHSSIVDEQECIDKCRGIEEGACISSDGSCKRTARSECTEIKSTGSKSGFNPGMLCSHPDLSTNCAPQQSTACVGEDVYWFDSCGNKENIYNSNKKLSYNSGYVQKEDQACKASPNDPDCGNCNYLSGSLCGEAKNVNPKYGNYICKDMNCYNVYENAASPNSGGNKKHGESWCLYDAAVGPGKDVVGSRQRRAVCLNGEEVIEDCKDYREEYCIQNKVGDENLGISVLDIFRQEFTGYTEAMCKENKFEDCNSCTKQECCEEENKDCYWASWGNTGDLTAGGLCVPLVPPGLKFWDSSADSVCNEASQTCKVEYKRSGWQAMAGEWECTKNCQCTERSWLVNANKYCKAMGDCGAWYNVEGKLTTDGYSTPNRAPKGGAIASTELESWSTILSQQTPELIALYSHNINYFESQVETPLWILSGLSATSLGFAIWGGPVRWYMQPAGFSPLFWTLFGVLLVSAILSLEADSKTETYTFNCEPWKPPESNEDCTKCDKYGRECTEYLCKSLGKNCELVNEGTTDQKCIVKVKTDTASPFITPGNMSFEIIEKENGFEVDGLVKPFTPVELFLNTNEPAQCKFSLQPLKAFDIMEYDFGSTLYITEHNLIIPIPSEATKEEVLLATNGGIYNLYIKCKDSSDNTNTRDYSIKFQIDSGPDQTPPSIEKTLPDNNSPIPYGKDKFDVRLLLNEPSDCKWSLVNKDYTQMENSFICLKSGLDISTFYPGLYDCTTSLSNIKQNQMNTFYIRCADKANNVQQQSYVYSLVSTPPLQITDIKPKGKVYTRYPVLEVTTSQGANNGIAVCGFNEKEVTLANMLQMFNTNSTEHSQQLQPTQSGSYTYYVSCVDKAGNIVSGKTQFDLEISLAAPQIYNIYKDKISNILHISTTEDTECQFLDKQFTYGTGTAMTNPNTKDHTAPLGFSVYYILCQDKFNNQQTAVIYP